MKNGRFSDAQIMAVLKQADGGLPVSELCREHGMSSASFYKWRAKFGGMCRQDDAADNRLTDAAIQTCLTMRVLFGMALRRTTGF